jgi:hypothetical protein
VTNTYAVMQARIADELDRADLGSQIQNAIQDAIGFYERKYFYFTSNPQAFTFSTVAGQEYYGNADNPLILTVPDIYRLNGSFYGLRRPLHKRSWEYIDNISTLTTSRAQPVDWAYNGEEIRLYPIPDNAYVITAAADPRPARPAANNDAGVWMNDAEALIRTRAKLYLLKNVIRAADMEAEVALLTSQEREEYAALAGETASREATGQIEPSAF